MATTAVGEGGGEFVGGLRASTQLGKGAAMCGADEPACRRCAWCLCRAIGACACGIGGEMGSSDARGLEEARRRACAAREGLRWCGGERGQRRSIGERRRRVKRGRKLGGHLTVGSWGGGEANRWREGDFYMHWWRCGHGGELGHDSGLHGVWQGSGGLAGFLWRGGGRDAHGE